ncbi:MAG: chloride channel protein [Bacteroidales bacterium]
MATLTAFIKKRDLKVYFSSILIGIFVGLFSILFRYVIDQLGALRTGYFESSLAWYLKFPLYIACIYFVLLLINYMIIKYPIVGGNGAEQTRGMLNGHLHRKEAPKHLLEKFIGSVFSLGSGMSLGHEGPSIQFGGYIGMIISRFLKITPGREEYMLSAGASAGVAAALNAPLAGPIYIIESLQQINNIRMSICSLLAGLVGGLIAYVFMPDNPYRFFVLKGPELNEFVVPGILIVMGIYMMILGTLFTKLVEFFRKRYFAGVYSARIQLLALTVMMALIGYYIPLLLGSGQPFMIAQGVSGTLETSRAALILLISFLFTAFSQGTTFPGGAFLPLLTVGGLSGRLFGLILLSLNVVTVEQLPYFMFLGMSAMFVIVMRTPLTGFLLVLEMTGHFEVLLPSLAVGIVGYFLISTVKMKSLPASLYNTLLKRIESTSVKTLTIAFEAMPNSYFIGKDAADLNLPSGTRLLYVKREHREVTLMNGEKIEAGDQLYFAIQKEEVEKVYLALLSLSSDQL